eukprot:TRINITY_DN12317_c0_g1_i2.p1 TRINITY_DN12317_c0_g1~~TRINITY_DN12317_c0_g1_i2.p1  ORF type:complete len:322 (-),score=57.15 TRINITY_DN12317_c0_g1_i2:27-992(-)
MLPSNVYFRVHIIFFPPVIFQLSGQLRTIRTVIIITRVLQRGKVRHSPRGCEVRRIFFFFTCSSSFDMERHEEDVEAYLLCNPNHSLLQLKHAFAISKYGNDIPPEWESLLKKHHNRWPTDLHSLPFKEDLVNFYNQCSLTSMDVLKAFEFFFEIPRGYFQEGHSKHDCTMELKHYYPESEIPNRFYQIEGIDIPIKKPKETLVSVNPHVDLSSVTILVQNDVHGLEVLYKDSKWISAPKLPNCILINTGDVMERFTRGYFPSTIHRVLKPKLESRYSVVYFCVPNCETLLEPIFIKQFPEIPETQLRKNKFPKFGDLVPI